MTLIIIHLVNAIPDPVRLSMVRIGESPHALAVFDRTGGVYIEPEYAAETEWYRDFRKQYEQTV